MPTGTAVAKCVLMQLEHVTPDGGGPPTISDIDLSIRVKSPTGHGSCASFGTLHKVVSDISYDWKSMVAVEASEVSGGLGGKCLEVEVRPYWVESSPTYGVTTKLVCYSAEVPDDAP